MACDPNDLIEQAKCIFTCIPKGMLPAVNIGLLCNIANAGGGGTPFPSDGLIHYWKMEENSGSDRLDSVDAQTLFEVGGATGRLPGIHNFAANFTGLGQFLQSGVLIISAPWSISAWVNIPSFVGGMDLMEITNVIDGPYFTITALGVLEIGNPTDGNVIPASIGLASVWHLIVFTVLADGTYSISIDGAVFASAVAGTPPGPTTTAVFAASPSVGGPPYVGLIDEVAIWDRAISQSDVTLLWNSGTGTFL